MARFVDIEENEHAACSNCGGITYLIDVPINEDSDGLYLDCISCGHPVELEEETVEEGLGSWLKTRSKVKSDPEIQRLSQQEKQHADEMAAAKKRLGQSERQQVGTWVRNPVKTILSYPIIGQRKESKFGPKSYRQFTKEQGELEQEQRAMKDTIKAAKQKAGEIARQRREREFSIKTGKGLVPATT